MVSGKSGWVEISGTFDGKWNNTFDKHWHTRDQDCWLSLSHVCPTAPLFPAASRTLPGVLRASFWLTAVVFLPLGLLLYFLPATLAGTVGVSPLWLARVCGGILAVWGVFLIASGAVSGQPQATAVGGLVGGNLLSAATLIPAVIRQGESMPAGLRALLLGSAGVLTLLAVAALITFPSRRSRL